MIAPPASVIAAAGRTITQVLDSAWAEFTPDQIMHLSHASTILEDMSAETLRLTADVPTTFADPTGEWLDAAG